MKKKSAHLQQCSPQKNGHRIFKTAIIATGIFCSLLLIGCEKKDQLPAPSFQDAVYFYMPTASETSGDTAAHYNGFYSFFFRFNTAVTQDTFWLPTVRIVGNTASRSRSINLVVADSGTTAVSGRDYRLIQNTMPADSFSTNRVGVVLLRSAAIADSSVKLVLRLQPSQDFPGETAFNTLTTDRTLFFGNSYGISFTSQAVQPPYWDGVIQLNFGTWGSVKYGYMVQVLGKVLGINPVSAEDASKMFGYLIQVRKALEVYNAANPGNPMLDENGNPLSF